MNLVSKWHRELSLYLSVKPLLMLEGNVQDSFRYPIEGSVGLDSVVPLAEYLYGYLMDQAYDTVIFYSNLVGFMNPYAPEQVNRFAALCGAKVQNGVIPAEFKGNTQDTAPNLVLRALSQSHSAVAVVMEDCSHFISGVQRIDQQEVNSFRLLKEAAAAASSVRTPQGSRQNVLLMLTDKVNDLPAWLYLDNPLCRTIRIDPPDREERLRLISGSAFPTFFDASVYRRDWPYFADHPQDLERLQSRFVGMTDGMTMTDLDAIRRLSKAEALPIARLTDAVDLYKYGIRENPWQKLSAADLKTAKQDFEQRIKGQDAALERTLDVVKRAVTGMSGLANSSAAKPKGILFYAGPTGVGKTETAKALAEKLFGTESACIRFDMSEYGQSHSDQKLMGAPPGYVGYESGGQLTNAVKEHPFSILLFDEIEKAHPTILEKFLQILDDGRMTDGQGNTVYFTETIIIFTSNLGMYVKDALGQRHQHVTMDMPYEEVRDRIRAAVEDYFKLELGRPEILNRIGENIVVFDFIRQEAGQAILRAKVDKIIRSTESLRGIRLTVTDTAYSHLEEAALRDLSNGGRGIGNQVEALLINPLSRWVFDHEVKNGVSLVIDDFDTAANPPSIAAHVEEL